MVICTWSNFASSRCLHWITKLPVNKNGRIAQFDCNLGDIVRKTGDYKILVVSIRRSLCVVAHLVPARPCKGTGGVASIGISKCIPGLTWKEGLTLISCASVIVNQAEIEDSARKSNSIVTPRCVVSCHFELFMKEGCIPLRDIAVFLSSVIRL